MKNIFTSWLFFTSLMLFLIAAALTFPGLMDSLFGETPNQMAEAAEYLTQEAQAVWAEFQP